jgi:hypothetical protein
MIEFLFSIAYMLTCYIGVFCFFKYKLKPKYDEQYMLAAMMIMLAPIVGPIFLFAMLCDLLGQCLRKVL